MKATSGVVAAVVLLISLIVFVSAAGFHYFLKKHGYKCTIDPDKADWEKIIYDGIEYAVAVERKMIIVGKRKVMAYITPFTTTAGNQIFRERKNQVSKVIIKRLSNKNYADQIKKLQHDGLILCMGSAIKET